MDPKDRCRRRRSRALDVMIRSLVLFTHVVAVIGLFVGLVLEWFALDAMRRAATRQEGITWVRLIVAAQRVMSIAFGVILLSGLSLGRQVGVLDDGWMLVSYGAILLIALSLAIVYLMIGRPDVRMSVLVISIALLIAMLATVRKQPAASIVVEGHR
jgi:hypothetical protein